MKESVSGPHRIDEKDRQILAALQKNAGISNLELAEKVALSPSPCSRRVRLLDEAHLMEHSLEVEEAGYIRGRVTLLNSDVVGLPVNVFVQITLDRQKKDQLVSFEQKINQWPEVMECYLMAGEFDYLIRVVVPDLDAFHVFITRVTELDEVSHIKSSFTLKQVQYKTELPLDYLK